jgi:hypothetical protein
MHESVETDFAFAHAMLGDIYAGKANWQDAAHQYELARDVLSEYWIGRHFLVNVSRGESRRKELADLFEAVLQKMASSDVKLNRVSDAQAAEAKLESVRKQRADDTAAEAGTRPSSSPPATP